MRDMRARGHRLGAFVRRCLCAGFVCLTATAAWTQDKPVVPWMVLDLPPGSMPVNGKLTDGVSDTILRLVSAAWPEAEHRYVVVNTARAMASLGEGSPACFSGALFTPERERVAYFSLTHLAPPVHLVARSDVIAKLPRNDQGEVLPSTLFDRSDLRGLVVPQRSYSPVVDALLNLRRPDSGIRTVLAADSGANILKMLQLNRADYTLEYDFILTYQQSRNPELRRGAGLRSLPVAGTAPPYIGIACPRTEWGRAAIQKIDGILSRLASNREYQNAMNRWLTPEAVKRYTGAQTEFFRQRAKPSDPAKYLRGAAPP